MFSLGQEQRYRLYSEATDLRKNFYTLSGMVNNRMWGRSGERECLSQMSALQGDSAVYFFYCPAGAVVVLAVTVCVVQLASDCAGNGQGYSRPVPVAVK